MTLPDWLYLYMNNAQLRIENDLVQLGNNLRYRDVDYLDMLEYILARHRLEVARELFTDLRWVVQTYRRDDGK